MFGVVLFVCLFVFGVVFCVVCFLLSFSGPSDPVDVIACESKVACKFSFLFSVIRDFERYFEGFRGWECHIMHRINLLYLLNLAEPKNVQILRGRHPANPRSHAHFQFLLSKSCF